MQNLISLDRVTQYFDTGDTRIQLLRELTVDIQAGHSYAILGPSGSGKSSLLMLMAGLEPPKSGRVHFSINGRRVTPQQVRAHSGFVFQHFHLLPELDAINNLALPLRLRGDGNAMASAARWLQRVGLENRAGHRPRQLSGGEQQRIAIARALITGPRVVFADEPTGNLDEKNTGLIADLLFSCCEHSGSALVMVTHNQRLAARAQRRYTLLNGRLEKLQ